ncbi:unnamed protein product [Phytophthora fragariaefolia]|uniref:Unnamed protein product n=1 Tax=Phytophthora fragariaefolia TaxID=1490495 RepID=A0A9W6Y5I5_9STRA|nr:unnamed protein product [Phytophthora fragariaefolia]
MSVLDQVLNYANGLKPRTRSYVKLENPETLSAAMDLANKYEVTHFVDDVRDRQSRQDNRKASADQVPKQDKPFKGKPFRGKGRFKPMSDSKLNEGPGVAESVTGTLKIENIRLNILCENPLVYKSRPLFSVTGEISVGDKCLATRSMLLDCGATTIYVSKRWVEENRLEIVKFSDKDVRVKLGDNQIVESELEVLPMETSDHCLFVCHGLNEVYKCVAVVYAIPDEFDCILGIPFFEDMQPQVDWRSRRIEGTKTKTLRRKRAEAICEPIEEGRRVIASGLRRSVEAKGLSAKRPDSCRGATLETDVKLTIEAVINIVQKKSRSVVNGRHDDAQAGKGSAGVDDVATSACEITVSEVERSRSTKSKHNVVEKMFTMGVVGESGVQTKYITRKKLRKFLGMKTKMADEPDFMLVLSNETFKQVARSLQRRDQPDNVGSAKAQRYLETDWDTFRESPAFNLLTDGDSRRSSSAEVRWVEDMVKKKLIRPSISSHAAPTFCVRKPVGWRIFHDYRYLNSNTVRQSIPMTRNEDILDAISGAYWFSTMDLMSAYYQVRMREEDIKFTAFQALNGLWEYLVLPMGVCNAPATMHRLTSKLFRDLKNTKSFYDDIYVYTKSPKIEDHLTHYVKHLTSCVTVSCVKLSKCVFCADETPCLGDFVGHRGVRMDPDKVQTIKNWPVPRAQEELHSFLGLTGYVQWFCPEYASLTATMFTLLKKKTKRNAKIHFSDEQLRNFKELKRRLCNPPVSHLPDFRQPMHLRTDASKFAVGGVCSRSSMVSNVPLRTPAER